MRWTEIKTGKQEGLTLPQLMFKDPDWFYYFMERFNGPLKRQSKDIFRKASSIQIPERFGEGMVVQYGINVPTGKFMGFSIVREYDLSKASRSSFLRGTIDVGVVHGLKKYDKGGYKVFLGDLKECLFGSRSYRMSKQRCEDFFNDDSNFVLPQTLQGQP